MSGLWSENAALYERFMEIYSNPPILYYGFNQQDSHAPSCKGRWCQLTSQQLQWLFVCYSVSITLGVLKHLSVVELYIMLLESLCKYICKFVIMYYWIFYIIRGNTIWKRIIYLGYIHTTYVINLTFFWK